MITLTGITSFGHEYSKLLITLDTLRHHLRDVALEEHLGWQQHAQLHSSFASSMVPIM